MNLALGRGTGLRQSGEGPGRLDGLGNLAGAQTATAHAGVHACRPDEDVHPVQIGTLDALGLDVRVADSISHLAFLAANFTLRWHGFSGGGYH